MSHRTKRAFAWYDLRPGGGGIVIAEQFVETPGLRIHTRQAGTGRPVIFLHGFPETGYAWRFQLRDMGESFACFAPDLRGFGETDKPGARITRALLARDLADFMDALGVERAALVGHDWGGIVAFKFAVEVPERVTQLVLLDAPCTVWSPPAIHGYWFKAAPYAEEFFERHHRDFIEPVLTGVDVPASWPDRPHSPWRDGLRSRTARRFLDRDDLDVYQRAFSDPAVVRHAISYYRDALPFHVVTDDPGSPGRERVEFLGETGVASMWLHPGGLEQHPDYGHFMDFGPEDRGRRFTGPTLLLRSVGDALQARRVASDNPHSRQYRRYFPDLTTQTIPAGHFFPEEAHRLTSEAITAFLAGTADAGRPN